VEISLLSIALQLVPSDSSPPVHVNVAIFFPCNRLIMREGFLFGLVWQILCFGLISSVALSVDQRSPSPGNPSQSLPLPNLLDATLDDLKNGLEKGKIPLSPPPRESLMIQAYLQASS
jgi:hypothetical protein